MRFTGINISYLSGFHKIFKLKAKTKKDYTVIPTIKDKKGYETKKKKKVLKNPP